MRTLLDTSVLVALERRQLDPSLVIEDDDEPAIPAIVAAELLLGVELSDESRRLARVLMVEQTLERLEEVAYDLAVARAHAALLARARGTGLARGAHVLIIAATASATGRTVVTRGRGFDDLPGVAVRRVG